MSQEYSSSKYYNENYHSESGRRSRRRIFRLMIIEDVLEEGKVAIIKEEMIIIRINLENTQKLTFIWRMLIFLEPPYYIKICTNQKIEEKSIFISYK